MFINFLIYAPGILFFITILLAIYRRSPDVRTMKIKYAVCGVFGLLSVIAIFAVVAGGESTQTGGITVSWLITFTLTLMSLILLAGQGIERLMRSETANSAGTA